MPQQRSSVYAYGKENLAPPSKPKRFSDAVTASSVYSNDHVGPRIKPLFSKWSEISPPSSPEPRSDPSSWEECSSGDVSPANSAKGKCMDNLKQLEREPQNHSGHGLSHDLSRTRDRSTYIPIVKPAKIDTKGQKSGLSINTRPDDSWRGGSVGGSALSPATDKPLPLAKRPIVPRRSSKRPVSSYDMALGGEESEPIKPILPLKVAKNISPRSVNLPSPRESKEMWRPNSSLIGKSALVAGGPTTSKGSTWLPTSAYRAGFPPSRPESVQSTEQSRQREKSVDLAEEQQQKEPPSRFSWTTVATNASRKNPPDGHVHFQQPEQPPVSRFSWTTVTANLAHASPSDTPSLSKDITPRKGLPLSSLVDRNRPIASANHAPTPRYDLPRSRKPTPSQLTCYSTVAPSDSISQYNKRASTITISTSKALPLSPPELASVDLITSLQAQLDDLRLRRTNLETLRKDLTKLQPQNPVVQDLARRREIKERVEGLEREVEGLRREEYEVGLRLHRAWKRREGGTEASAVLWVRRVTG